MINEMFSESKGEKKPKKECRDFAHCCKPQRDGSENSRLRKDEGRKNGLER